LAQPALVRLPAPTEDLDGATGRLDEALEDLDGGRLSRAVRTEEAKALARVHVEVEPVDGNEVSVGLPQAAAADGCRVRRLRAVHARPSLPRVHGRAMMRPIMSSPLTSSPAWQALSKHREAIGSVHMRDLFAKDPGRFACFSTEACGIFLDYSKHRITDE